MLKKMGISIGKIVIGLLIIWLVIIVMLSGPLFHGSEPDEQVLARLTRAVGELEALKQQNEELRTLLTSLKTSALSNDYSDTINSFRIKLSKADHLFQNKKIAETINSDYVEPSKEFEVTRRKIENGVTEMWYYLRSQLKILNKTLGNNGEAIKTLKNIYEDVTDHKRTILIDSEILAGLDGLNEWRIKEAEELSNIVQARLHYLQNPKDCSSARKLVCNLNKGCGYGCQVHHAVYCFIVAYSTERTLILRSHNWRYAQKGWETVFLPLSETCLEDTGKTRSAWPGTDDTQIIDLPIIDNVRPRPAALPLSIPKDLSERLIRLHGNPSVWWIGQFLKYLLRPQENLAKFLAIAENKIDFNAPIIGIHVRRTDKVGTEAAFHGIEEYMEFVDEYYQQLELVEKVEKRRIYLATDEPNLLQESQKKYPNYVFLGDANIAKSASLGNRYSSESLKGVILDIYMLSRCNYLVCTFSSQVCRLAYEIMQTIHPDASSYFHSLDDIFYFGGQNDHSQIALYDHHARSSDEIDLRKGDIVGIAGNHWDGYSKGVNRRTQKMGLYPSYKVVEKVDIVEFPTYQAVDKNS